MILNNKNNNNQRVFLEMLVAAKKRGRETGNTEARRLMERKQPNKTKTHLTN